MSRKMATAHTYGMDQPHAPAYANGAGNGAGNGSDDGDDNDDDDTYGGSGAREAPRDALLHNIAAAAFVVILCVLVMSVYALYALQRLQTPPQHAAAALLYASLLDVPPTLRLELGAPRSGAPALLDAALVTGVRCHCCLEAPMPAAATAAAAAAECRVVPCALEATAIVVGDARGAESEMHAAAHANATDGTAADALRMRCYAIVAHRLSFETEMPALDQPRGFALANSHWFRETARALERERHGERAH